MAKPFSQMTDAELLDVTEQMIDQIGGTPALYHTTGPAVTALVTMRSTFDGLVTAKASADSASVAATAARNGGRTPFEAAARSMRDGAKVGGTSDADMASAGMPLTPTPLGEAASKPAVLVDTSDRFHHKLSWTDAATPNSKKRPHNAIGVEIWHKLDGPAPVDVSECSFVAMDTVSPYVIEYPGSDGGKLVHYMVRWQLKDGTKSPFGDTASATVTA